MTGTVQVSNAKTVDDLSGWFNNLSLHLGAGLGGGLDLFSGDSPNGRVDGAGISAAGQLGASAGVDQSYTELAQGFQMHCPAK